MPLQAKSIWETIQAKKADVAKLETTYSKLFQEFKADGDISPDEQTKLNQVSNGIAAAKSKVALLEKEFNKNKAEWEGLASEIKKLQAQIEDIRNVEDPAADAIEKSLNSAIETAGEQRFKDATGQLRECQADMAPAHAAYVRNLDEWLQSEGRYQSVQSKHGEIKGWKPELAAPVTPLIDGIEAATTANNWKAACEKLIPAEEAVEEPYSKFLYETMELEPHFELVLSEVEERHSAAMSDKYKEIVDTATAMEMEISLAKSKGRASKQFELALDDLKTIDGKIDKIEVRRRDLSKEEAEAERVWDALEPRVKKVAEDAKILKTPSPDDMALLDIAKWIASQGEYIAQLLEQQNFKPIVETEAGKLEEKVDEFEEKISEALQRHEYMEILAQLDIETEMGKITEEYPEIEAERQNVRSAYDQMKGFEAAKNWSGAKDMAKEVDRELTVYHQASDAVDEARKQYEEWYTQLLQELDGAVPKDRMNDPEITKLIDEFHGMTKSMETAAMEGRYHDALAQLMAAQDTLSAALAKLHELLEEGDHYQQAMTLMDQQVHNYLQAFKNAVQDAMIEFPGRAAPIIKSHKPDTSMLKKMSYSLDIVGAVAGVIDPRLGSAIGGVKVIFNISKDFIEKAVDEWEFVANQLVYSAMGGVSGQYEIIMNSKAACVLLMKNSDPALFDKIAVCYKDDPPRSEDAKQLIDLKFSGATAVKNTILSETEKVFKQSIGA